MHDRKRQQNSLSIVALKPSETRTKKYKAKQQQTNPITCHQMGARNIDTRNFLSGMLSGKSIPLVKRD